MFLPICKKEFSLPVADLETLDTFSEHRHVKVNIHFIQKVYYVIWNLIGEKFKNWLQEKTLHISDIKPL